MVETILIGVFILIFIVLGIAFSMGKWTFLIAGYNTMSKVEKESYDIRALGKFMGKLMFIVAFCISLFMLSEIFKIDSLLTVGVVLLIGSVIFAVIYCNTGNRFKIK